MIYEALCSTCRHLLPDVAASAGAGRSLRRCSAFPDGIPLEIISTEANHHYPIDGDHGIQYERDAIKRAWE